MIRINLLPPSYRKPETQTIQQFHRSPLAFLIAGGLVGLLVLLLAFQQIRSAQLAKLDARLQQLAPQKAAVDELRLAVQRLRDQAAVYERLTKGRQRWTKVLNTLSDVTPDGVWYTDLSFDLDRGLVVQGSAIGQGGEEMVRIGRLVQDLKTNPGFASLIQDVQIESIKSVQDKELELIEFTLTGGLAKAADGPSS